MCIRDSLYPGPSGVREKHFSLISFHSASEKLLLMKEKRYFSSWNLEWVRGFTFPCGNRKSEGVGGLVKWNSLHSRGLGISWKHTMLKLLTYNLYQRSSRKMSNASCHQSFVQPVTINEMQTSDEPIKIHTEVYFWRSKHVCSLYIKLRVFYSSAHSQTSI